MTGYPTGISFSIEDSLLTYAADRGGRFWALLGHTNLGGISVWAAVRFWT